MIKELGWKDFDYLFLSKMVTHVWYYILDISDPFKSSYGVHERDITAKLIGNQDDREFKFRVPNDSYFLIKMIADWKICRKNKQILLWKNCEKRKSKRDSTRDIWDMDFLRVDQKYLNEIDNKLKSK